MFTKAIGGPPVGPSGHAQAQSLVFQPPSNSNPLWPPTYIIKPLPRLLTHHLASSGKLEKKPQDVGDNVGHSTPFMFQMLISPVISGFNMYLLWNLYVFVKLLKSTQPCKGKTAQMEDNALVVFCIAVSDSSVWLSCKGGVPEGTYVTGLECIQDAMQVHLDRLEKFFKFQSVRWPSWSSTVVLNAAWAAGATTLEHRFSDDVTQRHLRTLQDRLYAGHQLPIRAVRTNTAQAELGNCSDDSKAPSLSCKWTRPRTNAVW
ncbi:hypothetical protein JB92DRAFT_2835412 [Gautieria morchelliformis]|nr:hypothetical protein JB92DRAFT_2835412 [Gautieria morchelliformis]